MAKTKKTEDVRCQRKVRNFLLKPSFQLRYGFYFLGIGAFCGLSIHWLIYRDIRDAVVDYYLTKSDKNIIEWLDPTIVSLSHTHLVFMLIFTLVCFAFGIYITHRVVGPVVAIKRQIENLRQGNYKVRVSLRAGDELKEIAEQLNMLAEELQDKNRETASEESSVKLKKAS